MSAAASTSMTKMLGDSSYFLLTVLTFNKVWAKRVDERSWRSGKRPSTSVDDAANRLEDDVLGFVTELTGDPERAVRWYREEPIPAYGGRTAQEIVAEGHGHVVLAFLKDLENGATG